MFNRGRIAKTVVFVIGVLFCGALAAQRDDTRLVAVLEPVGNAGVTTLNKRSVRGTLEECVTKNKEFRAVDRARTNRVLMEHRFQRNGMVDNNKVQDIGKILNANFVFVSELYRENTYTNISVSLIDVETGVLKGARNKMMEGTNPMTIQKLVDEMATDLLDMESSKKQRDKK